MHLLVVSIDDGIRLWHQQKGESGAERPRRVDQRLLALVALRLEAEGTDRRTAERAAAVGPHNVGCARRARTPRLIADSAVEARVSQPEDVVLLLGRR